MKIKWLYVRNFRGFDDLALEFETGINEIVGKNAQGKTSLLEAIYLCMTGSSFRTSSVRDLIKYEKEGFFIEIGFEKEGITYKLQFSFDGQKRRIFLNNRPCPSVTSLIGQLLGVLCTPDVQELVKGAPSARRHFLDLSLAQIDPLYVYHLSRYTRALKQRNSLLKAKDLRTITVWEKELAHSATYITAARLKIVGALKEHLVDYFDKFAQNTSKELSLEYTTRAIGKADEMRAYFEEEFNKKRLREMAFGSTLVGPHRDDLLVFMGKKNVRDFASEGEMRLVAISLKLAEWQYLKSHMDFAPLLLIDDFGAYLDKERVARLSDVICTFGQVFISAHATNQILGAKSKTFILDSGKILVAHG